VLQNVVPHKWLRAVDLLGRDAAGTSKTLFVGIHDERVAAGQRLQRVIRERPVGVKVQDDEDAAAFESDDVLVSADEDQSGVAAAGKVGHELHERVVEFGEKPVFQTGIVTQTPLPSRIVITPAIALARKIDPLGVAEFVAHEREVPRIGGCFVQHDGAVERCGRIVDPHVGVHLGAGQVEDQGFAADDCLVVAFDVTDGVFLGAFVGERMPDAVHAPVLVAHIFDQLKPVVRNAHGEAVVEAAAACRGRTGQARHAADVFRDGDGVGTYGVDEFVGQGEVHQGLEIDISVEVVGIGEERFTESAVVVEHAGDAVETEAVDMVFIEPEAAIGEQEVQHFRFAVVEAARIPGGVLAPTAGMEILIGGAVETRQPLGFIFDGMRMHEIDDNAQAHAVSGIDQGFQFVRCSEAG